MAQFGTDATQLSAPQGAGSSPIAPATTGILDNGVGDIFSKLAHTFEAGLTNQAKAQAEAAKQAVVSGYANKLSNINTQLASGNLSPGEANVRTRALNAQYQGNYSQYTDDLEKTRKAFSAGSELGEAEQFEKDAKSQQKSLEQDAMKAGYLIEPYFSAETRQQITSNYQQNLQANNKIEQIQKNTRFEMEVGRFTKEQAAASAKEASIGVISDVASNTIQTLHPMLGDMLAEAKAKGNWDEVKLKWGQQMASLDVTIKKAGLLDPGLGNAYSSIFDKIREEGFKALDPNASLDQTKSALDSIVNARKLSLVKSDPRILDFVAASSLLGPNGQLVLAGVSNGAISALGQAMSPSSSTTPALIGTEVGKGVFTGLGNALQSYSNNTMKDTPEASKELVTGIETGLRQAAFAVNNPDFNPKQFAEITDLLSKPSYIKFVKEHPINPQVQALVKDVFKTNYTRYVEQGVSRVLTDTLNFTSAHLEKGKTGDMVNVVKKETRKLNLADVSLDFSSGGVQFNLKKYPEDPRGRQFAVEQMKKLQEVSAAVNKTIRLGAHLEGREDYDKYWEENKHRLVPSLYPYPTGAVVDGFEYSGKGSWQDRNNWKKVGNGTK